MFTGQIPTALTGLEFVRVELALMEDGVLFPPETQVALRLFNAAGTAVASGSGTLNSITMEMWKKNQSPQLVFDFSTSGLAAGIYTLRITVGVPGSYVLDAPFFLETLDPLLGTATAASPPVAYTQTETNGLFYLKANGESLEADVAALSGSSIIRVTSQSFPDSDKEQGRINMNAASAGEHADFSSEILPRRQQAWRHTLTANTTATAAALFQVGTAYHVTLIQDATGGRTFTWPAGCEPAIDALIDPTPLAASEFTLSVRRGPSGPLVAVRPLRSPTPPTAIYGFSPQNTNRLGGSATIWTDPTSGLVSTQAVAGDRPAYAAAGISGKKTAVFGTTKHFFFGATSTTPILDVASTAGVTVACVWDFTAAGSGEQFLASLGAMGLALRLTSGGSLAFGGGSPVSLTCAKDTAATLCVATYKPGGNMMILLRKDGVTTTVSASASAAASGKTEWVVGREYNGTNHFQGRIARLEVFDSAMDFRTLCSVFERLTNEFGL